MDSKEDENGRFVFPRNHFPATIFHSPWSGKFSFLRFICLRKSTDEPGKCRPLPLEYLDDIVGRSVIGRPALAGSFPIRFAVLGKGFFWHGRPTIGWVILVFLIFNDFQSLAQLF